MYRIMLAVCALLQVVSAFPPRHIKGIQIKNTGPEGLWIEMTNEDSFALPPGQMASVILEDTWAGKIFARSEDCQYKKCNSPYTVAELNFGGDSKEDKYRVSVANGYNKPIKIQPTGLNSFCKISTCNFNLKENCPKIHQVTSEDNDNIVSCKAIPEVFEKLCPQATELFSCKTSNTYFVAIG